MISRLAKSHEHLTALIAVTAAAREAHAAAVQDYMRSQIPAALAPEIGAPSMEYGGGSCRATIAYTARQNASVSFSPTTGLWAWNATDPHMSGQDLPAARDALLDLAMHLLCRTGRASAERLLTVLAVGVELTPIAEPVAYTTGETP